MRYLLVLTGLVLTACSASQTSPAGAAAKSMDFDGEAVGGMPPGWRAQSTKPAGPDATWSVHADAGAVSAPNVIALTAVNHESGSTFNLCWTGGTRFLDGVLDVSVRADGGEDDQGGGPMWRVQDADNYYVCRFNPLESNFRLYVVRAGVRKQLATATLKAAQGEWLRVRVEHVGKHITCSVNGVEHLKADDDALSAEGGVGVWTKADALTSFDDLKITPATR